MCPAGVQLSGRCDRWEPPLARLLPPGPVCRVGAPVEAAAGRHAARPMAPRAQAAAVAAWTADRDRPPAADLPGAPAPRHAHPPAVCGRCPQPSTAPSGHTPAGLAVPQPRVVGTAKPAPLSPALAQRRGHLLRHTACRRGRLSSPVVRRDSNVAGQGLPRVRVLTMALAPCPYPGPMAGAG